MIIVELLIGADQPATVEVVLTFREGKGLGHPLTQGVVAEAISLYASCSIAAGQLGELAPGPGSGQVVVTGGTTHGVVGDGSAAVFG